MLPIDILEKIIEKEGSCNWIRDPDIPRRVCADCPINGADNGCASFTEELFAKGVVLAGEQNANYKRLAEKKLAVLAFEEILIGEDSDDGRAKNTGEDN